MDNFYWVPQTYDSHISFQNCTTPKPGYATSARYAVDFYYAANQQKQPDGDCLRLAKADENMRAAHSGIVHMYGYPRPCLACCDSRGCPPGQSKPYQIVDIISSDRSFATTYIHLNPDAYQHLNGKFVQAGEVIGKSDARGCASSGAHLHFRVWRATTRDGLSPRANCISFISVNPNSWVPLDDPSEVKMDGQIILLGGESPARCGCLSRLESQVGRR